MKLIERIRSIGPLKGVFGNNAEKADYYDHIWQTEIKRGNITQEQASIFRQEILNGTYTLFFIDAAVGFGTHWGLEKLALFPLNDWANNNLSPEQAAWTLGYFGVSNVLAIPYFIPRAVMEYSHLKSVKGSASLLEKASLATSVLLNATLPPFTIGSTPALNFPRYREFSFTLLRHHFQNSIEPLRKMQKMYQGVVV